jgi:hypothetical protein
VFSKVKEQIEPLLLGDKWEDLPLEVLSHILSIGAQKETIELGDLVSDVYPAFEKYREDINEALKLAFLVKEKFVKKYVEDDTTRERISRAFSNLWRKLPNLNYKTASALGSMVLIMAACSPIVSSTPAGAVPGGSEIPEETIVLETEEETSPTPMLIEAASPTPFPTPFPTPTPTETPKPLITEVPSAKPSYSFLEEYKKNGYAVSIDTIHSSEFGEQLVVSFVLPIFTYQGYEVTADGDYMIGEVEIQGEKYVVKMLIDPEISHYNTRGSSSYYLKNKKVADKFMKSFVNYCVFVIPIKTEEEDIFYRANIFNTYSEEDWRTFRSEFKELLAQGGSTPEQEIVLYIVTPFDEYEQYIK